jgi:hypothetical protein
MALGHPRGAQNASQALRMLLFISNVESRKIPPTNDPTEIQRLLIGSRDNPQKGTLHQDYLCIIQRS